LDADLRRFTLILLLLHPSLSSFPHAFIGNPDFSIKKEAHMNVLAINGSPRKKWNTATLLEKALEGAASMGAKTTLIHLLPELSRCLLQPGML